MITPESRNEEDACLRVTSSAEDLIHPVLNNIRNSVGAATIYENASPNNKILVDSKLKRPSSQEIIAERNVFSAPPTHPPSSFPIPHELQTEHNLPLMSDQPHLN